jgi:hypothetical protein
MGKIKRSPFYPKSTGAEVTGTRRQLELLDLLQGYDFLLSTHIKSALGKPQYVEALLTLLNNEGYIAVPEEAKHHIRARSRTVPYQITNKGIALLKDRGLYKNIPRGDDQYRHKYLVSSIKASFEIACRETPGLRLITEADILANENCPPATRKDPHPSHIPLTKHTIEPDHPIFGLEYTGSGGGKAYMFFHGFEADRATYAGTSKIPKNYKKTITSMVRYYRVYLAARGHYTRYGLTQISIPIFTINQGRALSILDIIKRDCPPEICPRFIVAVMPDAKSDIVPDADGRVVTKPYLRYVKENGQLTLKEFNILETLQATANERKDHEARRQSEASQGAHQN